jgi:hypothetical protein
VTSVIVWIIFDFYGKTQFLDLVLRWAIFFSSLLWISIFSWLCVLFGLQFLF